MESSVDNYNILLEFSVDTRMHFALFSFLCYDVSA